MYLNNSIFIIFYNIFINNLPIIVILNNQSNVIMGFATYDKCRVYSGFNYSIEYSNIKKI